MHGKDHPAAVDAIDGKSAEFRTVLSGELDLLEQLRGSAAASKTAPNAATAEKQSGVYARAHAAKLAGLAFSGGGIRSATFNLGILQALASKGMLSKFDYLSTVSGGGYIGGWLAAWLYRHSGSDAGGGPVDRATVERFQSLLQPHPTESGMRDPDDTTTGFPPVEHVAVRYLRRYSNYLAPRLGLSGDMLTVVSIFLRNLTLIQFCLITLLAGVLLSAHLLVAGLVSLTDLRSLIAASNLSALLYHVAPFLGSILFFFVAVWKAGRLLATRTSPPQPVAPRDQAAHAGREVCIRVVLPCTLAGLLFAAGIATWNADVPLTRFLPVRETGTQLLLWVVCAMVVYASAWGLGYVAAVKRGTHAPSAATNAGADVAGGPRKQTLLFAGALAGAVLGLLLFAAARYADGSRSVIDIWYAVAFGTPLFLLGLAFTVTVHIGIARRQFSEHDREWWARLGGLTLLCAVSWTLVFVLLIYATPFVHWLAGGGPAALSAWAAGSGIGAWLARSPSTGDPAAAGWKEQVTRFAPWLFIVGLAVIVAHLTHVVLLDRFTEAGYQSQPIADFGVAVARLLQRLHELSAGDVLIAWLIVLALFALSSWRFDINLFSLHAFYRNRLARAFIGASNAGRRQPNPFTGFDPFDDVLFHTLSMQRPIPIVNTAINMTGGDDLAWQTRRATAFTFTPCWTGYETRSTQGKTLGCYRPTNLYAGGLHLGTLVAVSGAAASPNMGYHTAPAVSALLTAFNLRLGRWCGNPTRPSIWKEESPWFAAKPILAELSGSANADADWVNLTDGGHFENLGVYELVRRRCRFILVTDAGCDPCHEFEDLANLIRKCWTDFGVDIHFENFEPLHRGKDSRYSQCHGAVGTIRYPRGAEDQATQGVIVYLKCALTGDEPPDIRQYADAHKEFPHETTADQFFDENQFEAYRHLGYHIAANTIETLARHCNITPARSLDLDAVVASLLTKPLRPCIE